MVRPVRFGFNEETAGNNAFQQKSETAEEALHTQQQAVREFDAYVALLQENGVDVDVLQDTAEPFTPDSIFPNNCFSTHIEGEKRTLVLYPMYANNRRLERDKLMQWINPFDYDDVIDLSGYEQDQMYLEGTGSLVLDREHHIAYACLSPRTHEEVVREWADIMGFDCVLFDSTDENGVPIYHTNVMMHVGTGYAVVCMDSINDPSKRELLRQTLQRSGKEIVEISYEQMNHFAGNMLEVHNHSGEQLLVMSATARTVLTFSQLSRLEKYVRIIAPDIHAIETAGGGSARCMLAEIFENKYRDAEMP